jgi:hypothetical protein
VREEGRRGGVRKTCYAFCQKYCFVAKNGRIILYPKGTRTTQTKGKKSTRTNKQIKKDMSMVKMEVDKELMDLDVSSWSVFETIKLTYHYIFITFYVVFHDF